MAYPFQSNLFRDDKKLDECARLDAKHIWQHAPPDIRKGRHVHKIQMVLTEALHLYIDDAELRDSTYGPTTAAAVLEFKTNHKPHPIQRPGQRIDNIVGIMTIKALDDEAVVLDHMDVWATTFSIAFVYSRNDRNSEALQVSIAIGTSLVVTNPALVTRYLWMPGQNPASPGAKTNTQWMPVSDAIVFYTDEQATLYEFGSKFSLRIDQAASARPLGLLSFDHKDKKIVLGAIPMERQRYGLGTEGRNPDSVLISGQWTNLEKPGSNKSGESNPTIGSSGASVGGPGAQGSIRVASKSLAAGVAGRAFAATLK